MELLYLGLTASLVAGLATGAGALPAASVRRASDVVLDAMLGFAAGVMLSATAFSLLAPAIELGGPLTSAAGLGAGALAIHFMDRFTPHLHPVAGAEGPSSGLPRAWLMAIAMAIHNCPRAWRLALALELVTSQPGWPWPRP